MVKPTDAIYKKMLSELPCGVLLLNTDRQIVEWNHWLESFTEISKEEALNQYLEDLFPTIKKGRFDFAIDQVLTHKHPQVLSQILNNYFIPIRRKVHGGKEYMKQSTHIHPVEMDNQVYAMVVILDVTGTYYQRRTLLHMAKQFEEDSQHDELTSLYNRRVLWEFLGYELSQLAHKNHAIVCTIYDLDHFKQVNDELGHKAGDDVLRSFASIINDCTGPTDKVFRYGGEEFISISLIKGLADAGVLAEKVRSRMSQTKKHFSVERVVTCSAGFSIAMRETRKIDAMTLVKNADTALYQAKATGRNKVCKFKPVDEVKRVLGDIFWVDASRLELITHHNKELILEFYTLFVKEVEALQVKVEHIFSAQKYKALGPLMHKLKTSAKTVGANRLADAAQLMEDLSKKESPNEVESNKSDFLRALQGTLNVVKKRLKDDATS